MTRDEAEEMLKILAQTDAHGWQKAAAEKMGMTPRGVRKALSADIVSSLFERKIKEAMAGVQSERTDDTLDMHAGAWIIGEPVTRQRSKDVLQECVVTHLASPAFALHLELRSKGTCLGREEQGNVGGRIVKRVKWFDKPTPQAHKVLKKAVEIGEARINKIMLMGDEILKREELVAAAKKRGDADDTVDQFMREAMLRAPATAALLADHKYGALDASKLREQEDDISSEISGIYKETAGYSHAEKRAFDAGSRYGFLRLLRSLLFIVSNHAESDLGALAAAKFMRMEKAARTDTQRGRL